MLISIVMASIVNKQEKVIAPLGLNDRVSPFKSVSNTIFQ